MKFQNPTYEAVIHKRYKRFLSDIELPNGEIVQAHVPNTGSMKTCWEPHWKALVTHVDDPKRKLKYTLELTHNGKTWICVNTSITNKIVQEALETGKIPELIGYSNIKPEQKVLDSRIDFFLSGSNQNPDAFVEVKNVTLVEDGLATFPDAVSTRGQKHLADLIKLKKEGKRAIMLYILNRRDAKTFSPADDIDPKYGKMLREAAEAGVEVLVYNTKLSPKEITIDQKIDVVL